MQSEKGEVLETGDAVGTSERVVVKEYKEEVYIIIVKGDVNCDRKVDFIKDVVMLNNYRLKRITLDTLGIMAGDVDQNENIDFIKDIVKINNYRLNRVNEL